jgi:Xaa-Pro aminopeptidase
MWWGLIMTESSLKAELEKRLNAAKSLMEQRDLRAIIIPAAGGPGLMGMAKYFTNLVLWAGRAYVLLGVDEESPIIVQWSGYGAAWNRQEAVCSKVETSSDSDALGHALAILTRLAGTSGKIGVEHVGTSWTAGEWERCVAEFTKGRICDLTDELDQMRSVKSPFEIEAISETGRIISEGFDRFCEVARPGVSAWAAAAAAEAVVKAQGCYWGRQKYAMDERPFTIPTALDRRFTEDDSFVFELVYCGPLGYWSEMTALFSFKPLSQELRERLAALEEVIATTADAARPGVRIGELAEISNASFTNLGYVVEGKHTPDCHSIGLDELDGPSSYLTPDSHLEENMVLSFHPSTMLQGGKAFLISDNYLVTSGGGTRLSPKTWNYRLLEA